MIIILYLIDGLAAHQLVRRGHAHPEHDLVPLIKPGADVSIIASIARIAKRSRPIACDRDSIAAIAAIV